ncbi:NAD-binding protein, partial [Mycobacterium tuberculosis]|nr:NAD-binding protein [Mycobacterium tuberculosis]
IVDCGVTYYTSDDIMRIPELPEHLVIVGGGFVAAEFAHVFSALGVRVTIVVRGDCLLSHSDETICREFSALAAEKWDLRTHENVIGSHHEGD